MDSRHLLRQILIDDFAKRRESDASYSQRAYARHLDIQVSALNEVMSGKRSLTKKMALRVLPHLSLQESQAEEIASSLNRRTEPIKDRYIVIDRTKFEVIAHWHYLAIVTFCELDDFDGSETQIAQRMELPLDVVRESVSKLIDLRILERVDGRLVARHAKLATTQDLPSEALQETHREHLQIAASALRKVDVRQRDFSFINMAVNRRRLPEAKRRIQSFRRALCKFLESGSERTAVYRLGLQLFPLTDLENGQ